MKREVYRKVVAGVREYSKTIGGEHQNEEANAVYAIQLGKKLHRIDYHACFGKMANYKAFYPEKVRGDKPLAVFVQINRKDDLPEEALFHYLEWVLNMSPWRHAFVSKSVRKVLKDRVVVIDPEQDSNYMANAMMAVRQGWENYASSGLYKRINLWWDVAQHVNPNIAFALSHQSLASFMNDNGQVGPNHHGHTVLSHSDDHLFSFLKENRVNIAVGFDANGYRTNKEEPDQPWSERMRYDSTPSRIWNGLTSPIALLEKASQAIRDANTPSKNKKKVNPFLVDRGVNPMIPRKVISEALISVIPEYEKVIYG